MFCLPIGDEADNDETRKVLASKPENVVKANSYETLDKVIDQVVGAVCDLTA